LRWLACGAEDLSGDGDDRNLWLRLGGETYRYECLDGYGGLVDSGTADDAGLLLQRYRLYGRHHCNCTGLYVLRWPRTARRRRCRKTTGRTVCLIRSFDYDRTYSGCVWQRTRQFHDHENESGPVFNPIKD